MIRKIFAIDLTPNEMLARDQGHAFFPIQPIRELIAGDGVDLIETSAPPRGKNREPPYAQDR